MQVSLHTVKSFTEAAGPTEEGVPAGEMHTNSLVFLTHMSCVPTSLLIALDARLFAILSSDKSS